MPSKTSFSLEEDSPVLEGSSLDGSADEDSVLVGSSEEGASEEEAGSPDDSADEGTSLDCSCEEMEDSSFEGTDCSFEEEVPPQEHSNKAHKAKVRRFDFMDYLRNKSIIGA